MSLAFLISLLLWLALASLAWAVARRAAYWRLGRAAEPGALGFVQLLTIPKRYFVDLHQVVARDPYIARAHVATAGGALSALVLVFVNYGLALYSPWLDRLILLAALVMLGGWLASGIGGMASAACRSGSRAARGIRCRSGWRPSRWG